MKNIQNYMEDMGMNRELIDIFNSLAEAVRKISLAVRMADTGKVGTKNTYGEEQVALDIFSNRILVEELEKNRFVGLVASEELEAVMKLGGGIVNDVGPGLGVVVGNESMIDGGAAEYAVAFDPLDGSSLVDVNLSVGTIAGIYKAKTFVGMKGDDQVAALIAVYGPRTTVFLTVKRGVVQFVLDTDGELVLVKDNIQVGEGKMFAPGNLRACKFDSRYLDLVNFWISEQYTLRYSGGMVPDINQIMIKGKGIFAYPGYSEEQSGKLRLLFECAPMALLMEQAFGAASDGKVRILDKIIEDIHQRTPIFIGSKEEVERCEKYLAN